MQLIKHLVIWIVVMTVVSFVGLLAFYMAQNARVPEAQMVISVIGGVVMGFAIGLVRYLKQRKAEAAKSAA